MTSKRMHEVSALGLGELKKDKIEGERHRNTRKLYTLFMGCTDFPQNKILRKISIFS